MDFLNKSFAQVVDLFNSMTPGARLTAALLIVVVGVSVGYLFTHQISAPSSDLMHGVPATASQLPKMEAAFAKAKLSNYEIQGTRILVPRGQEATFMAALAENNALPANFGSALNEAVNGGNVFESAQQRQERIKNAVQSELSLVISKMEGIESASVLFDEDNKPGFKKEKIMTATAAVKPQGSQSLDPEQVTNIRYYVAGAIAGMKPENVTINDLNGRTHYGNSEGGTFGGEDLYGSLKRKYEQELKSKILNALCFIPNVTVEPTMVLDTKKGSRTTEIKHDPKTTVITQKDQSSSRTQDNAGSGGRPGFASQQPNTATALASNASSGSRENEEDSVSETVSVPSGTETQSESVGMTPKLARVAIGIPSSYWVSVWRERNPTADGQAPKEPDQTALDQIRTEESAKFQKYVAQLLPTPVDGVTDVNDMVAITTFQNIPGKLPHAPDMAQNMLVWLGDYWQTAGMIVLAVMSLMMLRSLVRSAPLPADIRSMPNLRAVSDPNSMNASQKGEPEPSRHEAAPQRVRHFTSGPSLRDELSDLVQEDPDTAANILRGWIGQGV